MNASGFFTADEDWLKEQPNMNPYPEGCAGLLRHLHVWVKRYTPKLCSAAASPDQPQCDGYRQRSWGCWRFHWQPDLFRKKKTQVEQERPRHRVAHGIKVAIELVNGTLGSNLVRDVILAEAVTQADPHAVEILEHDYATQMKAIATKTSWRYGEEAWANVFAECFRARGQSGRLAAYRGQRPLASYLATVVTHEVHHLMKKTRREKTIEPPEPGEKNAESEKPGRRATDETNTSDECDKLLQEVLSEALHSLAAEDRLVLYYRFVQRMKLADIGRILKIHKGNVARRLRTASDALAVAIRRVVRERKQERSVAECVDQIFGDLRCSNLAELLVVLLRQLGEELDESQGGGADEHDQD